MRVETKVGGDGVGCWNVAAIQTYVDQINQNEARLGAANPDLVVMSGRVRCYGCEVMEYDYGIKCTAELTRTRYGVHGEIQPRPEDAVGSLGEIPGLETRAPEGVRPVAVAADINPHSAGSAPTRRRGLFGRPS